MLNSIGTFLRRYTVLFDDKMPVWLTLALTIGAAAATYYVTPSINRQFQIDAARKTHLAKTTEELNSGIIQLSEKERRLNSAFLNHPEDVAALREDCLDLVTQLQWQLVDLRVVLKGADDQKLVDELAKSLSRVKLEIENASDDKSQGALVKSMAASARAAEPVLDQLYHEADLK